MIDLDGRRGVLFGTVLIDSPVCYVLTDDALDQSRQADLLPGQENRLVNGKCRVRAMSGSGNLALWALQEEKTGKSVKLRGVVAAT